MDGMVAAIAFASCPVKPGNPAFGHPPADSFNERTFSSKYPVLPPTHDIVPDDFSLGACAARPLYDVRERSPTALAMTQSIPPVGIWRDAVIERLDDIHHALHPHVLKSILSINALGTIAHVATAQFNGTAADLIAASGPQGKVAPHSAAEDLLLAHMFNPIPVTAQLTRDAAQGLHYLHTTGLVINGGLKPENIVIQSAGSDTAKFLIAPDMANTLPPATHGAYQASALQYAPPEVLLQHLGIAHESRLSMLLNSIGVESCSKEARDVLMSAMYTSTYRGRGPQDMWALGCIIFEAMTGRNPFAWRQQQAAIYNPLEGNAALTALARGILTADVDADGMKYIRHKCRPLHDLIKRLLVVDPSQRLTVEQVLKHPFVQLFARPPGQGPEASLESLVELLSPNLTQASSERGLESGPSSRSSWSWGQCPVAVVQAQTQDLPKAPAGAAAQQGGCWGVGAAVAAAVGLPRRLAGCVFRWL